MTELKGPLGPILIVKLMNIPAYTIVDFQQGTKAWHEWRSQGIGASDAPAIMGENPWKSPSQLMREKCGGRGNGTNAAMARGTELEPEARKSYEIRFGVCVVPACLQSTQHSWLRASVDGLAKNGSVVVEIKCGESVYRKTSTTRKVPGYYFGQLQHILAVTSLPAIDFWCYLPARPEVHIRVARDDSYIKRLLDAEHAFWQEVQKRGK
ncbi:MAG: YqaJ viral recombinase family protein [Gammaproteobacteria bacterium]|nr:YqaJ viral recombinase family protein [Gammaproteobacteria bacterium]